MSMTDRIGKKGRIKSGENTGFFIRIQDDSQNTGGYLVFLWKEQPSGGYDNWVKNLNDLEQFLDESGWDIEWLE